MAVHLPEKIARLIGDLRTIFELTNLIEHEMEKRIVARHAWVKIDSLLDLLPRLKNDYRRIHCRNDGRRVSRLEGFIERLNRDYQGMAMVRDAMAAHALPLDLLAMDKAWRFMCETTFCVIAGDIEQIEQELACIAGKSHVAAGPAGVDSSWPATWSQANYLGDPTTPRFAVVYPAFGNANVRGPVPINNRVQDAMVRAGGLMTYLLQVLQLMQVTAHGSVAERLFAEILVNDYCALWEMLFEGGVRNEYGVKGASVLDDWGTDQLQGAACLAQLRAQPHLRFNDLKEQVRNKVSAHLDPDAPLSAGDVSNWPMDRDELITEVARVLQALRRCAIMDIRTKAFFMTPAAIKGVVGFPGDEERTWKQS